LTGTAEKHDAFFETSYDGTDPVEKFGGAQLVQQEPDASSFPNGELEILLNKRIHRLGSYISSVHLGNIMYPNCFISYTGKL
jgi:glutamine synthetase